MQELLKNFKIHVNEKVYLKDPESSELGKKIISNSIYLIADLGFESFTFKKLATAIGSTEASVYRYFENKHKLLLYLTSWYWAWIEYQVVLKSYSIQDAQAKLEIILEIITRAIEQDSNFSHIDEVKLNQIIINEYSKSFLTKEVDADNKEGFFAVYKRLVNRVKEAIINVDKNFQHPASLASSILEGALHQHFLRQHFPTITDCNKKITPSDFYKNLVFNSLNCSK